MRNGEEGQVKGDVIQGRGGSAGNTIEALRRQVGVRQIDSADTKRKGEDRI